MLQMHVCAQKVNKLLGQSNLFCFANIFTDRKLIFLHLAGLIQGQLPARPPLW